MGDKVINMDINRFVNEDVPECYYSISIVQAAVNYYMLYESWAGEEEGEKLHECELKDIPGALTLINDLVKLVEECFEGDCDDPDDLKNRLLEFRESIKQKATGVATYSDLFKIYEYILNRTKPVEKSSLKAFNNDAEARDVLSAVFSSGENSVINENIRLAVGQLPMRITKARFFDIIDNSLKKYIDADKVSFDRLIYMLKSSAGIYERDAKLYPVLEEKLKILEQTDSSKFTDESFEEAEKLLNEAVGILTSMSELYQSVEQVVNLLCVIMLTYPYVSEEERINIIAMKVLTDEANEGFRRGNRQEMSPGALGCLEALEGKFEPAAEKLQKIQSRVVAACKADTDIKDSETVRRLDMCERLVSPSVFADLTDEDETPAGAEYVEQSFNGLKKEFEAAFEKGGRMLNRARMAAALAELPVFFVSRTDVMNYVRESLESCHDVYEKMVSVRLVLDEIGK